MTAKRTRMDAAAEAAIERAYASLVTRLDYLVHELERLGESEMGVLPRQRADTFHDATYVLYDLLQTLKREASR